MQIDEDNNARLTKLTLIDKYRLRNQRLGLTRIIFAWGTPIHQALKENEFKHSPFKNITGGCGTSFVVCDLLKKEEVTFAGLKYNSFRIMSPNEAYYQAYDDVKGDEIDEYYGEEDLDLDD